MQNDYFYVYKSPSLGDTQNTEISYRKYTELFKIINKKRQFNVNNSFDNAVVIWLHPSTMSCEQFQLRNYYLPTDKRERFINSIEFHEDVPRQIITNKEWLYKLDIDLMHKIKSWISLINTFDYKREVEIVLGYRSYYDYCGYSWHIQGRIRQFQQIGRLYGEKIGYKINNIIDDLNFFNEIFFWVGKYPKISKIKAIGNVVVNEGYGALQKNIDERIERLKFRNNLDELESLRGLLLEDKHEWLSIKLHDIFYPGLDIIKEIVRDLSVHITESKPNKPAKYMETLGINHPIFLSEIPDQILDEYSFYFAHLTEQVNI